MRKITVFREIVIPQRTIFDEDELDISIEDFEKLDFEEQLNLLSQTIDNYSECYPEPRVNDWQHKE